MAKKTAMIGVPLEPNAAEEFAQAAMDMRLTQAEVVRRLLAEFMRRYRDDARAAAVSLIVVKEPQDAAE